MSTTAPGGSVGGLAPSSAPQVAGRPLPGAGTPKHPQAHHVLQEPDGAVDAGLVGEVGLARRLGQYRRVRAPARPATTSPRRCTPSGRRRSGTPTTAEAVSCEPTAITGTSRAGPTRAATSGSSVPTTVARVAQRREQVGAQAELLEQRRCPLARRGVVALGGRGVGALGTHLAGEPVRQQVREEQQRRGVGVGLGVRAATSW